MTERLLSDEGREDEAIADLPHIHEPSAVEPHDCVGLPAKALLSSRRAALFVIVLVE